MLGWSVLESPINELRRAAHAFQTLAFELATKLRELKDEIDRYCGYGNQPGEDSGGLLESSHSSLIRLSIEELSGGCPKLQEGCFTVTGISWAGWRIHCDVSELLSLRRRDPCYAPGRTHGAHPYSKRHISLARP